MLLNAGYGVVEMAGGFLADSQALKADALDFLGDGLITFFGIVALSWPREWRARAALAQGVFLAAMGVGVLWMFSRNDALGNIAVVIAAGLVALTATRWPDLIVAAAIAGLFLQSAWEIILSARAAPLDDDGDPGREVS